MWYDIAMIETSDKRILFHESQHFRQVWLWVLIAAISLVVLYGMFQQLILGNPFGNNPTSDSGLVIMGIIFGFGFPVFLYYMHLVIEVREDGLYYRFVPFHLSFRKIEFADLMKYQARTYSPIKDYGGWGIRYGQGGAAYNISGNRGVLLMQANGKSIMLGSQRPEELVEAINLALGKSPKQN